MIFLFVLQIIFAVLLIAIVLLQSSEEDALSGIGGSIGNNSILSHKSSVDLITKITIILGCCLIVNSLALAKISKNRYSNRETMVEDYLKKQEKNKKIENKVENKDVVIEKDTNVKEEIKEEKVEDVKENNEVEVIENNENVEKTTVENTDNMVN